MAQIGKRVSKNMVITGQVANFEQFLDACNDNVALYIDCGHWGYIRPAKVFACRQFRDVANMINNRILYLIIHYKQLQCQEPEKAKRAKKRSSKSTGKKSETPFALLPMQAESLSGSKPSGTS